MRVVLDAEYKNWILGGIIKDSRNHTKEDVKVLHINTSRKKHPINYVYHKYLRRLRLQENDLVSNQRTLLFLIRHGFVRIENLQNLRCFYTHDSISFLIESNLFCYLKKIKQVLVMNSSDFELLKSLGVNSDRISIVYGAINRNLFYPSKEYSTKKEVLVTGDAKERKNPKKIIEVINFNPKLNFLICGRLWKEYINGCEMKHQNFEIFEFSLELTAKLMRRSSTYLTLSHQEGGPFPVLEALASGTPVVATPVGWVPELINQGNGVVVNHEATLKEISQALEQSINLKRNLFQKDLLDGKLGWEEFAQRIFLSEQVVIGRLH